ncbi:MAG: cobyric acid synthase [Nitrospirota bacterium]
MPSMRQQNDRRRPSAGAAGRARGLAVFGTGSDVGKSVIAAGLCRLLRRSDVRVAPFKGQNMSLNAAVTPEGGEIGRAQAVQAEACGVPPHVDMNPLLLKPESESRSQVIVHGRVRGSYAAADYFRLHDDWFAAVRSSYDRLARSHEVIVIEGAGSAAEINLRKWDLANWPVAELADARVLLVADIDRGGVFAQVIGTLMLLRRDERRRVAGIVINKFRGDPALFQDGATWLQSRTGLPVSVVPWLGELELDQEDNVAWERRRAVDFARETVNIAVLLLPHLSNFTDYSALGAESDVALKYAASPGDLEGADVVILPGSKRTIADLEYVRAAGFVQPLERHFERCGEIVGLCGGYQMLGREIRDPHGVEGGASSASISAPGLGLLDAVTELQPEKRTALVEAQPLHLGPAVTGAVGGYEIHMGSTRRLGASPCFHVTRRLEDGNAVAPSGEAGYDGAAHPKGFVWGTYIHGLFDRPAFRRQWLNRLRARKGLPPLEAAVSEAVSARRASAIDRWADHLDRHLDDAVISAALRP